MKTNKKIHLFIICLTVFFGMSAGALLGPVFPGMVGPLQTTAQNIGMLVSAITFSTALFSLVLGPFTDRIPRKKILIFCLVLYGFTGLAAYFATDLETLLILRFLQGIGVAGMMLLSMLLIGDLYSGPERVHATSRVGMTNAIGSVFSPLIGGLLASHSWNLPFLFYTLTLPLALFAAVCLPETNPTVSEYRVRKTGKLDQEKDRDKNNGKQNGDRNKKTFSELLKPFLDFKIFHTIFLSFAIFFLLYALVIYLPFMLKAEFGYTSKEAGLALSITGITVILIAARVKSLTLRYPMICLAGAGFGFAGLAVAMIGIVHSKITLFFLLLLFGLGFGLSQIIADTLILQIAPKDSKGSIISVYNTTKYLGQTLSPIVFGFVLASFGLEMVFLFAGAFGLAVAGLSWLVRGKFRAGSGHEEVGGNTREHRNVHEQEYETGSLFVGEN
ncbi:MFS transporter [Methanosarcina sp. Mfa9]|uniref:MFS transporter n=1 Tax=Methanosarcina sp. Mfa9 TaxID=3439063 RepID=UPI003F84EA8E